MLRNGRYPWHVKQRIASRHGHLSNGDCAMLVAELVPDGTQCVVLAHISEDNNRSELAVETVQEELAARGLNGVHVLAAPRSEPTPVITVRPDGVTTADSVG
jgi:phosphoribosyl 1,2-cyclic phosphodiesterase